MKGFGAKAIRSLIITGCCALRVKTMNSVMRVALVAVMAMVFGLAGYVSNAEAVLVQYGLTQDSGTNVATGVTTDYNDAACATGPQDGLTTLAVKNGLASCADRFDSTTAGVLGTVIYNTAYAASTNIAGQATGNLWYLRERSGGGSATFTIEVFYLLANGTEVSLGSGSFVQPSNTSTDEEIDLSGVSGTAPAGSKLGYRLSWASGGSTNVRAYFGTGNGVGGGDVGYITVDETAGCSETATVNAVDPGVITGATAITATLGGSGGSAAQVRWSTDGGAFSGWQASGSTYTPPGGSTGTVDIQAQATGACGTVTDATPVATTYDTSCTTTGSILWNGTTTANGDFAGASLVGSTSNISGNVEYQVTADSNWGSCRTESGRQTFAAGTTGGTVTLGTTISDLSQSFVLVDSTHADVGGNTLEKDFAATGEITDANTLTFTRTGTLSDLEVSYQLVECFNNEINVQRGNITLSGAALTNTGTLGAAVDATKSMVLVNTRTVNPANENHQSLVTGEMTNGTTVTVTRDAGGQDTVAHYQVVEFKPSAIVSLQTGEVSVSGFLATPTTVNLGTAVNDGTSWLYFTKAAAVAGMDDVSTAGNITNAGADLKFYHESEGTSRVRWYVVEFPNDGTVKVQRGLSSFTGGADPATHNITVPTAVNATTKAFPYVTNNTLGNGTAFPRHLWVERLSTATNIELQGWNTDTANADADMEWQVIEFIGGGPSTLIPWSTDPLSPAASTVLTDGNNYNIYARGTDVTCGSTVYGDPAATNTTADGTPKTFNWSSCAETATLTLQPITDPITGNVTVTATGTATGIQVGTNPAPTNASGWTYVPAQDDNTTVVSFYATGTGTCGTLTDSQLNVATNTMAAPTVDAFVVPANVVDTTAPLDVPVTTFTASDNLAVTGYIITIDDPVAPLAGAAGWAGTAPTSVTVPGYATYTLRAYAKDAAGNVSVASSATVTMSNCVEAGTVTVSITPDPGAGDITGATTVTANLGGGATNGMVRWRTNGGAWTSWVASGATYTPTAKDSGTVDFEAMADGSCGAGSPVYSATLNRTYETRVDAIEPTGQSAAQSGLTSISATMVYCNDKNGTGEFQVDYKLASSGSWTNGTPITDGGAGDQDGTNNEQVTVLLTGLTAGETYDIRMTYVDATDGVIGTAVYTQQVILIAWADQPMLHNSNRFAGTVKHGGDWGTSTGYAGGIVCTTCHEKNPANGNIKRVKETISFPDGSAMPGGGTSAAVVFTTAVDGTSNFGDDSTAPRASSNRVCEVCHTFDGTVDIASRINGTNVHAANQGAVSNHYDNADCVKCHEHNVGFKASCDSCHASPPINNLTDLVKDGSTPADATGSVTVGKHVKHANNLSYSCNTCHTGWETAGEMPKGGQLNIGFVTPGGNGGTYNGRTGGGGYLADVPTGTTVNTTDALTCAVYCHGYGLPQWNDAGTAVCGACHGQTGAAYGDNRDAAPDGSAGNGGRDLSNALTGFKVGKHANHLDDSIAETGDPCALCHFGFAYGDTTHVDGSVDVTLRQAAPTGDNSTGGAGTSAVFSAGTPGTCSNLACHDNANWDSTATGGCNFCHGYPPNSTNNSHASGVTAVDHDSLNITPNHDQCSYCHGYKDNGSGALAFVDVAAMKGNTGRQPSASDHNNGSVTMNGDFNTTAGDDAGYNATNGGCDSTACHSNDATHRVGAGNTGSTIALYDIGPGSCGTCHDTGVGSAPVVTGASSHVKVTIAAAYNDCTDCHSGHYTNGNGVQIPNNATVGINYVQAGHGGIKLGGTGTVASISGKTTEAEICWGCHSAAGNGFDEFGLNTDTNGTATNYNYGTLSNNAASSGGWYSNVGVGTEAGATWDSPIFTYKQGAIQSTHSANAAGTATVAGANYAKTETLDAVEDIRCSYCHDVHDLNRLAGDTSSGKPWLRGTWKGNPYNEDGAPRNGAAGTWTEVTTNADTNSGQVPRASADPNNSTTKGGFWIDQNNNNPNNGETLATTAGLCVICHGSNVDTMDEVTGENLWVSGGNGHQNAVIGGSGTTALANNIFSIAKRGSNQVWDDNGDPNYYLSMGGYTPEMARRAFSWRGDAGSIALLPNLTGEHRYFADFVWDVPPAGMGLIMDDYRMYGNATNTVAAQTQSQYHTFNCGKCHNPHASRLPKLMITNCLDTAQNTWDETVNAASAANGAPAPWTSTTMSQWPSAQNCHRLADDHSTTSRGAGWNVVTPW